MPLTDEPDCTRPGSSMNLECTTMTSLVFLVPILVGVTASPLHQYQTTIPDNPLSKQNEGALPLPPAETLTTSDDNEDNNEDESKREYFSRDVATKDSGGTSMLSALLNRYQRNEGKSLNEEDEKFDENRSKGKLSKKGRKHKAIFVDYSSFVPRLHQSYSSLPSFDIGYNDIYDPDVEERRRPTLGGSKEKYQEESNIFYIRLPPTPYMFVPGLGYISQPPTYSTASLRPQIPHSRPPRPQPVVSTQQQQTWNYHQRPNPFIKLPIDFVSNGKPTSVYHWQKKKPTNPGKLPAVVDSPITNLDDLTPGFVSNGKPTTIYQWHTNLKPAKRPDDNVNNLDKGPYLFNGKPTSLYLLKPDGTTSDHRSIQYPDFENDNSYY